MKILGLLGTHGLEEMMISDSWKSKPWWQHGKGDYSDPPSWPSWTHYRLWRRAVQRWNQNTDVPVYRRAEKLLKGMDWQMQQRFDHLSEQTLSSSGYLEEILKILDTLAGERESTEMRRVIRAALYQGHRKADAQYSLRRDAEFSQASKFLPLPDQLKAVMLEEQANISKQAVQNLRALTNGQSSYEATRKALQIMDVGEDSLFKQGAKHGYLIEEPCPSAAAAEPSATNYEAEKNFVTDFDDDQESIENFLFAAEEMDLGEEQALSFLADWKSEANRQSRRTWSENRKLKMAQRKDRRHFEDADGRPDRQKGRRRLFFNEEGDQVRQLRREGALGRGLQEAI